MSRENKLEFFIYSHEDREFSPHTGDQSQLTEIITGSQKEISKSLSYAKIDALLVLDNEGQRWFLAYSDSLGIVGQRTARRQADTIARSGYRMPGGYTLKGNFPLDEMTEANIGDLWKTVQQKYVRSSLSGMSIDEETGLPSQLADRANVLESAGVKDGLTEAKFEKEEAEGRRRAMERSSQTSSAIKEKPVAKQVEKKVTKPKASPVAPPPEQTTTKKVTKKVTKPKTSPVAPPPEQTTTKKVTKKVAKKITKKVAKKPVKSDKTFFEITSVKTNVLDGNTQTVARGKLSYGTDNPETKTVIFDQTHLTQKEWTEIGLFLQKGDVVELETKKENNVTYATSLEL